MTTLTIKQVTFDIVKLNNFFVRYNVDDAYFYYKQYRIFFNKFYNYFDLSLISTWRMLGMNYLILKCYNKSNKKLKDEESKCYFYKSFNQQNAIWYIPFNFTTKQLIYSDGTKFSTAAANGLYFKIFAINNEILGPLYEQYDNNPYSEPIQLLINGNLQADLNPGDIIQFSFQNTQQTNFPARTVELILWNGQPLDNIQRTSNGDGVQFVIAEQYPLEDTSTNSEKTYTYPIVHIFNEFESNYNGTQFCLMSTSNAQKGATAFGLQTPIVGNTVYETGDVSNQPPNMPYCLELINKNDLSINKLFNFQNGTLNNANGFATYFQKTNFLNPTTDSQGTIVQVPPNEEGNGNLLYYDDVYSQYYNPPQLPWTESYGSGELGYENYYNFTLSNIPGNYIYVPPSCLFTNLRYTFAFNVGSDFNIYATSRWPMLIDQNINYQQYSYGNMIDNSNLDSNLKQSVLFGEQPNNQDGNLNWSTFNNYINDPSQRRYVDSNPNPGQWPYPIVSKDDPFTNGMRSTQFLQKILLNIKIKSTASVYIPDQPIFFTNNTARVYFKLSNIPQKYNSFSFSYNIYPYQQVENLIVPPFSFAFFSNLAMAQDNIQMPIGISSAKDFYYIKSRMGQITKDFKYYLDINSMTDTSSWGSPVIFSFQFIFFEEKW